MQRSPRPAGWGTGPGAASMSLLRRAQDDALDRDYAAIGAGRQPATRPGRVVATLIVVSFGVLVATAAVQAQRSAPALAEERAALVDQVQRRSGAVEGLRQRVEDLRSRVRELQATASAASASLSAVRQRVEALSLAAGAVAVSGPGIRVVVDDAAAPGGEGRVVDVDLQGLVNGLWAAGAEAVAIDGHRLSSLSAIRGAGDAITVNYRSLAPPYVIEAIGDPDTLPARLLETSAGQTMLDLEANFGLRFDVTAKQQLTLPADPRLARCCQHAQSGR